MAFWEKGLGRLEGYGMHWFCK